jgi:hypothetical protein
MNYEEEVLEARRYVESKLYPATDYETVWDLFVRSQLPVCFHAFAAAVGNSRRVKMTDGRGGAYAKRK